MPDTISPAPRAFSSRLASRRTPRHSSVRLRGIAVCKSHATVALEQIALKQHGYVLYHVMCDGAFATVRVNTEVVTRRTLRDRHRIIIGSQTVYFRQQPQSSSASP